VIKSCKYLTVAELLGRPRYLLFVGVGFFLHGRLATAVKCQISLSISFDAVLRVGNQPRNLEYKRRSDARCVTAELNSE
jgi:hypothetical protein